MEQELTKEQAEEALKEISLAFIKWNHKDQQKTAFEDFKDLLKGYKHFFPEALKNVSEEEFLSLGEAFFSWVEQTGQTLKGEDYRKGAELSNIKTALLEWVRMKAKEDISSYYLVSCSKNEEEFLQEVSTGFSGRIYEGILDPSEAERMASRYYRLQAEALKLSFTRPEADLLKVIIQKELQKAEKALQEQKEYELKAFGEYFSPEGSGASIWAEEVEDLKNILKTLEG